MSDSIHELRRLIAEAEDLLNGPAKIESLNEAVRVADEMKDVGLGFVTRELSMAAALGGGNPDLMTTAFTWCVGMSDRHPEEVPPTEILWEYRWVISELPHFPQVPRKQIEDTIVEMVKRYRYAGSSLRPVHLMRVYTYTKMGDLTAAVAALRDHERAERDWLSDSPRQELNLTVNHLVAAGKYEEAIARSGNVMTGRVDEPGFFGEDSAELLIPLLELGRKSDAVRIQRSGYRYLARKHGYLWHYSFHIEFLARTNNFEAAVKVVNDHLPIALDSKQFGDRTHFLRSVLLLVGRMRCDGSDYYKMRMPKSVPVAASTKGCDLVELTHWLNHEVTDYSTRFDARNGTSYFSDKLAAVSDLAARPAA